MPAEGVPLQANDKLMSNSEIYYLAKIFVDQGIKKIRLTGGEPTVRKDIVEIIGKYKYLEKTNLYPIHLLTSNLLYIAENLRKIENLEAINITTNGLTLTRLLLPMQKAGLSGLNISLDTLNAKKFEEITRRKGMERVLAGIDLACQLGYKPKVNCVAMKG